ncbi:hypothetical protein MRB53_032603 [Persea americana]|uniref:Uncharacterized protein n=1 Tax=Persea americana TaxID=3435 RepID=A0ACC2KSW3_PERAE|nr:hypothetical protein MRB53_032603 [Persea americana]
MCILKKSYVRERETAHKCEASKETLASAEEVSTEVVVAAVAQLDGTSTEVVVAPVAQLEGTSKALAGHPRRPLRLLKRLPLLEAAEEVGTVQLEGHPRRLAAFELETSVVQEVATEVVVAVEPVIQAR